MPFAVLSDAEIYYETSGNGSALLLIPGLGSTARSWETVTPWLNERYTTVTFDNRGVGRSKPKRPARSIDDYSVDVVELLDHLQIDATHILGQSLGGIIAQRFAADHPSRIEKLVLVSSTHMFNPYMRELVGLMAMTLRSRGGAQLFSRMLELLGSGPSYYDNDPNRIERARRKAEANRVPRNQIAHQLKCLWADEGRGEKVAQRIACPTLVVSGEYDAVIPPYYAQKMAAAITHSRFLRVPGAGHDPLADCPELLLPVIHRFLETGEAGVLETNGDSSSMAA